MGTPDLAERALLQGLIKVAAAYVHDVRGNPAGITRNLRAPGPCWSRRGRPGRLSTWPAWTSALIAAIDVRLADLADHPDGPTLGPPELRRSVP